MRYFCFYELFFNYTILNQLVNLTSVFIMHFVECFLAICNLFKSITHALYKQKPPCKLRQSVYMGKNFPPKRDSGFMKVVSLLDERSYFCISRILLSEEISHNQGSHFARMFFLQINTH